MFEIGISSDDPESDTDQRTLADAETIDESVLEATLEKTSTYWTSTADGSLFWSTNNVQESLPPGLYKCVYTEKTGYSFQKLIVSTDDLIPLPDTASAQIVSEIDKFWTLKSAFKQRGFLHKRGVLMYGEPGSGKTASIQLLIQKMINEGGMAIYADDPHVLTSSLQMLRRIEPERRVIVILEDFETLTDRQNRENEWLSVLDGEAQIDDVVFLATTNYIDKLDKRFTDRPSRFDLVAPVPMPGVIARALFLEHKEKTLSKEEVQEWAILSKGFSYAHLKEMIISVKCLGNSVEDTMERLRNMQRRNFGAEDLSYDPDGTDGKKSIGFTTDKSGAPITDEEVDWDTFWEDK